jgi:diaminopimelate epimerase
MHGLGNDFVIVDARQEPFPLDQATARAVANRQRGVGCDQVIVIERPRNGRANAFMRIHNADGGEVEACGNAARCVASLVMAETGDPRVVLETLAGLLDCEAADDGRVAVDLGEARTGWREVPLAEPRDTLHVGLCAGPLENPVAVNIGNPHAVFFVEDAERVDLPRFGPILERDSLFPERANIGVAQVCGPNRLRLRVWERGVGVTQACGTAAGAAVVAGAQRGLTERKVQVVVDGGNLDIEWRADGHVAMVGPVATVFRGTLLLEALR